jgi:ATP-dependent helicase/nuclease subunit A
MSDLKQLDAESRTCALEIESFIVEAPAGAGKTELLTQRYLKLLSAVNEPEEIIALTFTNKAAAEMRNRILQSLLDCENRTEITQAHKQQTRTLAEAALKQARARGWQLLTQPSRLRIMTMDALCSSLARQMPLLSRLGGQPMVSEDASLHYAEAAQLALAEIANESSLQAPVSAVLGFMNNDIEKLGKLLADMLAKREQWLLLAGQHTQFNVDEISAQCFAVIENCVQEKLSAALQALPASTQTILMPVARFAASNLDENHILLDWNMPLEVNINRLPHWLALRKFLLSDKGTFRKRLTVSEGFPPDKTGDRDRHIQTFTEVCELIGDARALDTLGELPVTSEADLHANSIIVQAFAQLLQRAAAHLWTVFQSANEVDFVAIAQSAIHALENEQGATDLALKLDYKISHLLVDEFQDTNATQLALLQQLTQGWEPQDGRTLFCVGDPMQSIYRFRKADVSLFLQAAERGVGHIPLKSLKLTLNNRSQPKVVEWINQTFKAIFPSADNEIEAAIRYRDFIATKAICDDEGVETHALVVDNDEESENTKALEAHYVADLITKEQEKNPQQKIAVLVRSRSHLRELVSEIRRNYALLKFQAVEIEELNQRQTVQDALSLTHALLHRADRVHWLNVLRAPWCGLTLADLHTLCADDHHATIWQLMHERTLSANGQARLNHVKNVLTEAFTAQGRMPLRRWLESAWLKLGGGNTLINAGDNRDVQAFFDLVEKLALGYALDFEQLETGMQKLYAEPDITANDTLQFLTIHKSKGLEFDCVILPALNRKPRHPDSPLMLWEEVQIDGKLQLLAAPYSKKKNNSPSIYDYIKSLETTRANNETVRLLYVAATRTMHKLHLVATAKRKNELITPVKNSFLELLWPKLAAEFLSAKTSKTEASSNQTLAQFKPQLMRLSQVGTPIALSGFAKAPTKANLQQAATTEATLNLAADCGTLAHLYMEIIANTGLEHWPESRIHACSQAMHLWLKQCGHTAEIATHAAAEVATALVTTIASDDGKWVLQQRENQYTEYALSALDAENNEVAQHKIDLTFVEKNTRWIIDYKLTQPNDIKDLQAIAQAHQAQLNRYESLFLNESLPIAKAVFFLSLGKLIKI